MNEYIESLGDDQVLSALDVNSGYWQIEVKKLTRQRQSPLFTINYTNSLVFHLLWRIPLPPFSVSCILCYSPSNGNLPVYALKK